MSLRELLWASVTGIVLSGAGCDRGGKEPSKPASLTPSAAVSTVSIEDSVRDTILSYMSQPKFAGSGFTQQVTGTKAKLEMFMVDTDMLYFSIPIKDYDHPATLSKLTVHPEAVEFGQPDGNSRLRLGDYTFSERGYHFFRFPAKDFRVDTRKVLNFRVGPITYTVTPEELADFIGNKNVYGGILEVNMGKADDGIHTVFSNHGAFVAKPGEPSLQRLVEKITRSTRTKEQQAQALLDFVSRRIRYDPTPGNAGTEVLQRPNEVLMAREGDCSGKVILYASLLEQARIDYRIAYIGLDDRTNPDHTVVAVAGNFPSTNRMSFTLGSQSFFFAETTVPGFKIGRTQVETPYGVRNMIGHQKPGKGAPVYDAVSGKALPFL